MVLSTSEGFENTLQTQILNKIPEQRLNKGTNIQKYFQKDDFLTKEAYIFK